jgi:hypothetical protein
MAGHKYPTFISHYKQEAGDCARILKDRLMPLLSGGGDGCEVFLDSDNLMDLGQLMEQVKLSDTLLLLQTAKVLTRPWCVVEVYVALKHGVGIVAVNVSGKGYDYGNMERYLSNLPDSLEEANPGATEVGTTSID